MGVPTVAPNAQTEDGETVGLGPAPGELLAEFLAAAFVYSWNGSAVVTQSFFF